MKTKKIIYIILAVILGLLLSFIAHGIIETVYINYFFSRGDLPEPSSLNPYCYLPSALQIGLLLAGLLGGYFAGRFWWQKTYPERNKE